MYVENLQLTFACPFYFTNFPFDKHECHLEYGSSLEDHSKYVVLNSAMISYKNVKIVVGDDPITISNSPLPFEFQLESLPVFFKNDTMGHSYYFTGMNMTLNRNTVGLLLTSYYFPTSSYALLSVVSFLINPDVVSGISLVGCFTFWP